MIDSQHSADGQPFPASAADFVSALLGTDDHPGAAEQAVRALRFSQARGGILAEVPLADLGRYAERLTRELRKGKDQGRARAAHDLLDLLRHPAVLRRIAEAGAVPAWTNRILGLVERSQFTFARLLAQRIEIYGDRTFLRDPTPGDERFVSWREAGARMDLYARGLLAIATERGEGRVGILSENRLETALLDMACLGAGIVDVMVPANATADDVAYILRHAAIGAVIVSSAEQLDKVHGALDRLPNMHTVIALDEGIAGARGAMSLSELVARAAQTPLELLEDRRDAVRLSDPATIMYTSGTTGEPKGIVFSQLNLVAKRFCRALALPDIGEDDVFLAYLPLFHTFGRFFELAGSVFWGATYCFAGDPSIRTLTRRMREIHPTVFISIPKKWIQLRDAIADEVNLEVEDDETIRRAVRRVTGGRLRWGLSAAGRLDPEIFRFFQRNGVELASGFGMTEATGGITMTPPHEYREDSLGPALPGVDIQLADDGELLVRGPYVMQGYLDPPDGRPAFDADGWFHTGDLMEMDRDGFVRIIDRKKEIYKNVKGQTIAPQRIEKLFRDFDSVGAVFLVGDHREYNTVLISPEPGFKDLDLGKLSPAELRDHFRSMVVTANSFLAPFERIVDFAVIDRPFDAEHGELTPKGTYRRKTIERNFSETIRLLYRRRVLTVGGVRLLVPNWFFQVLGLTSDDLRVREDELHLISSGTRIRIGRLDEGRIRIGSVIYAGSEDPLDLGALLHTPALWLGNDALVDFAPLGDEHRQRSYRTPLGLRWLRREAPHDTNERNRTRLKQALLEDKHDLATLHLAALALDGELREDALLAVQVLEAAAAAADGAIADSARRVLGRAVRNPRLEVSRRAFQVLACVEPPTTFPSTVSAFLDNCPDLLDDETIAILVERQPPPPNEDVLIEAAERRCAAPFSDRSTLEAAESLIRYLVAVGTGHPGRYRRLRAVLTRIARLAPQGDLRSTAALARHELETSFRHWLGPPSHIAVDPETGREYRWEDVVAFDETVETADRHRLLVAVKHTSLLREAAFLFFERATIQLADILPGGVWLRLLGSRHGKSVFRLTVQTRSGRHYDLAVNINHTLDPDDVRREIDWLILCGEPRARGPVVEDFGGYWSDHDLWTEEFIPGETLDRALRRLSRQPRDRDRFTGVWPFAAWCAASTYIDFWERTGRRLLVEDPSPTNVIVPIHDYQTGARLVSIAARAHFTTVAQMLGSLHVHLVEAVESEHPSLAGRVHWDVLFSALFEVVGEAEGSELLREAARQGPPEVKGAAESFLDAVAARGFLPMKLYFAVKRFHRWERLNTEATLAARARNLSELETTYGLAALQPAHPEVRVRFFRETVFREAPEALASGLEQIIQRLRTGALSAAELAVAVADLRATLEPDEASDFFLARLSFPHIRPDDEASFVMTREGGGQQSEVAVCCADQDGNTFYIRHALSPKEVGRLYRLFLAEKLPVQFHPGHRYLVAVNERGHIIGGLFYEVDTDARTAHMEKIVVADRYRRKGIAGALLTELGNRLKIMGMASLTTGFFRPQFFYQHGFAVERRYAGLVKTL